MTLTAGESPPTASTLDTFPTFTPAIRTAVPFAIGGAFLNTALTWNELVKGMSLVNARKTQTTSTTIAIRPTCKGVKRPPRPARVMAPLPRSRRRLSCPLVAVPWLPGGLPITVCPAA